MMSFMRPQGGVVLTRFMAGSRPPVYIKSPLLSDNLFILVNDKWRPHLTASLFETPPASHWVRPHWGQGHQLWRDGQRTEMGLSLCLPTELLQLLYNLRPWSLCLTVTGHTQYGWRHPQQLKTLWTPHKFNTFKCPAPSAFLLVRLAIIGA